MKINDIPPPGVSQLRTDQTAPAEMPPEAEHAPRSRLSKMDIIELSQESRLMQKASQVIAQTPEVRLDKIKPIAEAVQQNTYQVDSRKVANSLIASHILER